MDYLRIELIDCLVLKPKQALHHWKIFLEILEYLSMHLLIDPMWQNHLNQAFPSNQDFSWKVLRNDHEEMSETTIRQYHSNQCVDFLQVDFEDFEFYHQDFQHPTSSPNEEKRQFVNQ